MKLGHRSTVEFCAAQGGVARLRGDSDRPTETVPERDPVVVPYCTQLDRIVLLLASTNESNNSPCVRACPTRSLVYRSSYPSYAHCLSTTAARIPVETTDGRTGGREWTRESRASVTRVSIKVCMWLHVQHYIMQGHLLIWRPRAVCGIWYEAVQVVILI